MDSLTSSKMEEDYNRKYKAIINKISYRDDPQSIQPKKYKYSSESIQPFVYFWKLLALKPCQRHHKDTLFLNIPDTIVINDGDHPIMWFYTDSQGRVCRLDNVPYNLITSKLTKGALQKQLVAVVKKASFGYGGLQGNDVKLVSASEVKTVITMILAIRGQVSVIQKYVKSTSVKPSVVRTAWRANGHSESWTLSSNYEYTSSAKVPQQNKFIVCTKDLKYFTAIKCGNEKYLQQTLKYLSNIVKFVGNRLNVKFLQFVGDFVKDEGGNWWFINAKAFILDTDKNISFKPISFHDEDLEEEKQKRKIQSYTKCKKCKYCYKILGEHLMNHKLTLMMILQCDQNLIKMGKSFPWLQRCFSQHVGSVNLYVQHKICDSCFKLYKEIQKLTQLQTKMAKLLGVKVQPDNKSVVSITSVPSFKGYSTQFGSRLPKVKYESEMIWVQNQYSYLCLKQMLQH